MSDNLTWTNDKRRLRELVAWAGNPRQIRQAEAQRLAESLDQFGQVQEICIDPSGSILDGHQRQRVWAALDRYGPDYEVDVRVASRALTEKERQKLAIYLHSGATGDWDWSALAAWDVPELQEWGFDKALLAQWNDDAANLALMLEAEQEPAEDPGAQVDKAAELQEKWQTARGQTWNFEIAECGMCSLFIGPAEQARIMCDLSVFDPPFDWSAQQQENALSWVAWRKALLMGLHPCMALTARHDFLHWWVWDSGMARFGGKGYKPMSGCAILLAFGEKQMWYEDRALEVLDQYGLERHEWTTQVLKIQDHLAGRVQYEKPPALFDYIVALYSATGDVVGDPFAGSGSVATSCARLKRQYRGAEIDPQITAVALQRLDDMGLNPQLQT